ncbi:MAG: hypothetical protein U5K55_00765 [Aliarcobacter sp.]|nr:hypothetical protein [Aliarcobacter sp.]
MDLLLKKEGANVVLGGGATLKWKPDLAKWFLGRTNYLDRATSEHATVVKEEVFWSLLSRSTF